MYVWLHPAAALFPSNQKQSCSFQTRCFRQYADRGCCCCGGHHGFLWRHWPHSLPPSISISPSSHLASGAKRKSLLAEKSQHAAFLAIAPQSFSTRAPRRAPGLHSSILVLGAGDQRPHTQAHARATNAYKYTGDQRRHLNAPQLQVLPSLELDVDVDLANLHLSVTKSFLAGRKLSVLERKSLNNQSAEHTG